MLVPQSMAYAMLAGLLLQVGLYASILPLLLHALLGVAEFWRSGRWPHGFFDNSQRIGAAGQWLCAGGCLE